MKRKLGWILTLCMTIGIAALFTGCGKEEGGNVAKTEEAVSQNEASDEKAAVETETAEDAAAEETTDGKTFTLGFDAEFPPYGYKDDNGEYVGFDLDLAAEVCSRRGWELKLQPIDWDSKDMELESGSIDCIWNGFTMSEDRLDTYTWTEPYVDNSQVFVVAADSGIENFDGLAGKVVAVQADSSALEALQGDDCKDLTASFADLMQVPDYNTAFMNLEAGAVDAVALDIGVARYQLESRGDKFVMLADPIVKEQYGIGFKLGNEELRDQVQESLKEMVKDGKMKEISDKWGLTESVVLQAE